MVLVGLHGLGGGQLPLGIEPVVLMLTVLAAALLPELMGAQCDFVVGRLLRRFGHLLRTDLRGVGSGFIFNTEVAEDTEG
jgi:hypothetical protein